MRHFFLVDPFEKLYIHYDTSLFLAHELQKKGRKVALVFEKDFYVSKDMNDYKGHRFDSSRRDGEWKLSHIKLKEEFFFKWRRGDILHMRLDPPFDARYLKILWMLKFLKSKGVKVVNNPEGILLHNEKLFAYEQKESYPTLVGASESTFLKFVDKIKKTHEGIVMKPLDLYQGKGVKRFFFAENTDERLLEKFKKHVETYQGAVVVQPYLKEVLGGEIRATYFMGKELATVRKFPLKGNFLANMMYLRARIEKAILTKKQKEICKRIALKLRKVGVDWIAFDILGNSVTEVNITCPGLVIESSRVYEKNFFEVMIKMARW